MKKILFSSAIGLIAVLFCLKNDISIRSLNITTPNWARNILIGMLGYLLIIPVLIGLGYVSRFVVSHFVVYKKAAASIGPPGYTSAVKSVIYATYSISIAPFVQELFFRGALFTSLKQKMPMWLALVISSLVFALLHYNPLWVAAFFVLGLFYGYLYYKTGSLLTAIAAHAMNNVVALFFFFLY